MLVHFSILFATCTFEENLPQVDLEGTVRIPVEAATFTLGQNDDAREVTDARGIGPVFVVLSLLYKKVCMILLTLKSDLL